MRRSQPDDNPGLFDPVERRSHAMPRGRRSLILPRYLSDEAHRFTAHADRLKPAHEVICRWADLERAGDLSRKETSLDADFLNEVFGTALGFVLATQNPEAYHLEREFAVPGEGTADGALGHFGRERQPRVYAVIELKDANTNLDRDRFNGRTAVQQCWDYLSALPDCPWGIVSNFVTIRLYHRDHTRQAFEYFTLQELRDPRRFREFYTLLSRDGLLPSKLVQTPTALRLLRQSNERQREVGDDLYEKYHQSRLALIDHLKRRHDAPIDDAIRIAQKILDRIIFVAFCEDRGLLPDGIIKRTYETLPPLTKVTNPRWRNFLDLFRAVDEGHENIELRNGYDGGLFRHDPAVDDLQLDDEWTDFFKEISAYDFRDEVNLDVLGHLFERSVTELEKLRAGGLFEAQESPEVKLARMPKSAKRKRFGIYYTPADFTRLIVRETVAALIEQRFAEISARHGVDPAQPDRDASPEGRLSFWRDCLEALKSMRVCDPACGSGAFLIQAYDVLEEHYNTVADGIAQLDEKEAARWAEQIPDWILTNNLYGVDLSPEAVEITQLALWIRSARRGRTLADLSGNILCGNSLVTDPGVDPHAMRWAETFPRVFSGENPGFDCIVSNPPWERMKLQEREFFSLSAPDIAAAVSAAKRRSLIVRLERDDPALYARYRQAKQRAEAALSHARSSGEFALTAKGDINTYALFAELASRIVSPTGRVGMLVPSGIASDNTTKDFFAVLTESRRLRALYDFENRKKIFPDVDGRMKFSILLFGGEKAVTDKVDFVFFAHTLDDLKDKQRHIALGARDFALLNPNTRTCPIFRTRRDAELTKAIYRRVPVLVDESRKERGNPWGIRFLRMFDQTNDAELFHTAERLKGMRYKLVGNVWVKGKKRFLPLYEAKMIQAYDHRAASVIVDPDNWMRQGQTMETSLVQHQNTDFMVQPRWWVEESTVAQSFGKAIPPAFLCFKDVTSPTNERTMIASFIPVAGVLNSAPITVLDENVTPREQCCFLANLNSFVLDYVSRQKVGNVHLNFFIVKQFPVLAPDAYADNCPWQPKQTLEKWISDRVLKLTCTAEDMRPLAEACGLKPPVHKWKPAERSELLAELDAAFFLLYGVSRDDAEYILSTFPGTRRRDEAETGKYTTADLILTAYDRLAAGQR